MQLITTGWVVMTEKHGTSGKSWIVDGTFSRTRTEAIKKFIAGTSLTWQQWKDRYNYKCVKAESIIKIATWH